MKKLTFILFFALSILSAINLKSQPGTVFQPGDFRDGVYDKENATNRRLIPYTHLREGDVTWEKRVWRELDMREKQNQQLYYPIEIVKGRYSLFQVLSKHILSGDIVSFSDEEFLMPLETSVIKDKLKKCDSIKESTFVDGEETFTSRWNCDSTSIYKEVYKYKLKEDWFFDKQKSALEVRIIGIGAYQFVEAKDGYLELFWVYFPACRKYFAQYEVYNTKNDAERRTFEDIFWKRQFSSVAVKESNVYDRRIADYSRGIDALLESDRIKNDIFRWEHDLWHF